MFLSDDAKALIQKLSDNAIEITSENWRIIDELYRNRLILTFNRDGAQWAYLNDDGKKMLIQIQQEYKEKSAACVAEKKRERVEWTRWAIATGIAAAAFIKSFFF